MLKSGDILTLERGLYYAYPECTNMPPRESGEAFWLYVNLVDDNNKIIEAIPASPAIHYFYKAKKCEGIWCGWEQYLSDSNIKSYYLGLGIRSSIIKYFIDEVTFINGQGVYDAVAYGIGDCSYKALLFGQAKAYKDNLARIEILMMNYSISGTVITFTAKWLNDGTNFNGKIWVEAVIFGSS